MVRGGLAVIQVSRGDFGPALWELVRAQEVRLNPPRRKKGRNLEYQNEEAGYKYVATSRGLAEE